MVERQLREYPAASTIVSASTASTAQARNTEIASPSSVPLTRLGSKLGASTRFRIETPAPGIARSPRASRAVARAGGRGRSRALRGWRRGAPRERGRRKRSARACHARPQTNSDSTSQRGQPRPEPVRSARLLEIDVARRGVERGATARGQVRAQELVDPGRGPLRVRAGDQVPNDRLDEGARSGLDRPELGRHPAQERRPRSGPQPRQRRRQQDQPAGVARGSAGRARSRPGRPCCCRSRARARAPSASSSETIASAKNARVVRAAERLVGVAEPGEVDRDRVVVGRQRADRRQERRLRRPEAVEHDHRLAGPRLHHREREAGRLHAGGSAGAPGRPEEPWRRGIRRPGADPGGRGAGRRGTRPSRRADRWRSPPRSRGRPRARRRPGRPAGTIRACPSSITTSRGSRAGALDPQSRVRAADVEQRGIEALDELLERGGLAPGVRGHHRPLDTRLWRRAHKRDCAHSGQRRRTAASRSSIRSARSTTIVVSHWPSLPSPRAGRRERRPARRGSRNPRAVSGSSL